MARQARFGESISDSGPEGDACRGHDDPTRSLSTPSITSNIRRFSASPKPTRLSSFARLLKQFLSRNRCITTGW